MRLTLNGINAAIKLQRGGREELVRGRLSGQNYFWFDDGGAPSWYSQIVAVPRLSDLTLEQWLDEYDRLKSDPRNH